MPVKSRDSEAYPEEFSYSGLCGLVPDKMHTGNLRRVRRLGVGAEGTTWLEQNRETGVYWACKVMKVREMIEEMPREVWIRKHCMSPDHRSLVRLNGWCVTGTAPEQRCRIYYEYCAGGDLQQLIPRGHPARHPEGFIWHVFIQLAEALHEMHSRGPQHVVHRDVKPANVFLTSRYRPNHGYPTVKLGDYGFSCTEENTAATRVTWSYMGPEIECSAEGDIWALGAVIHALCHGFSPVSQSRSDWKCDPRARRPKNLPLRYSDALHWQVMSCLRADRGNRPNSETLVRRLHRERPREHS